MDLRQVEVIANEEDDKSSPAVNNESPEQGRAAVAEKGGDMRQPHSDHGYALQSLLDRIPVTSIPGSRCSSSNIVEIKLNDCILDAINLLYDRNISRAPIVDNVKSDFGEFIDRDIGFIKFSNMILWSLKELDNRKFSSKESSKGLRPTLEQLPQIQQTKIIDLANSCMWEPFFPVRSDASLFHVLLLFSKHPRLEVVPVMESPGNSIVGFITKSAVVNVLLQSSGLNWFDQIADKALYEYRFPKDGGLHFVYADESLVDALYVLWDKQISELPVVDRESGSLIGSFRCSSTCLLIDDANLFKNRKSTRVGEFLKLENDKADLYSRPDNEDIEAEALSVDLRLKSSYLPRMDAPTTSLLSDTLKEAMEKLMETKSSCSYLVNESGQLKGVLTLREIISQFAPPAMDASFNGGSFFVSVLEQVGSHVESGKIIQKA